MKKTLQTPKAGKNSSYAAFLTILSTAALLALCNSAEGAVWNGATEEAGTECELHIYPGAKHSFFQGGDALKDTLEKTERFLSRLGYLPKDTGPRENADPSIQAVEK